MTAPYKHIINQGPTLAALGSVFVRGLSQQLGLEKSAGRGPDLELPGPEFTDIVPPRPRALVRDYVRNVGGDPGAYKRHLPPHLCNQWFFPIAGRTLRTIDYPLFKLVNGGCRLELNGPLPTGEPLRVAARLESIDDNGRRAILTQRVATGTSEKPELVIAKVTTLIPLGGRGGGEKKGGKEKKKPARVSVGAKELAYWRIPADAGLAFALLTGDFNPVHWLRPYAKLFGHRGTILHGFATLARAIEGLNRGLFAGDTQRLAWIDGRFTRPLLLPAKVGLYVDGDRVFVGDGPGGPAYLVATYATRDREDVKQ